MMGLFKGDIKKTEKEYRSKIVNELKAIISEILVKIQRLDILVYGEGHGAYTEKFENFIKIINQYYIYLSKWANFKLDEEGVKILIEFLQKGAIEKELKAYSKYLNELKNIDSGKIDDVAILRLFKEDVDKILVLFRNLRNKIDEINAIFISDINKDQNLINIFNMKKYGVIDPKNWIILPARTHEDYSYPDLLVSKDLFYKEKNWFEAHELLQKEDFFMLTIRQFFDFLILIKSENVCDGTGEKINPEELAQMLKEILGPNENKSLISEWLDAKFKKTDEGMFIEYNHRLKKGKLIACDLVNLDKLPWLSNLGDIRYINKVGLPFGYFIYAKKDFIYNRYNDNPMGSVAQFQHYGIGMKPRLECYINPETSGYVRAAKIKKV